MLSFAVFCDVMRYCTSIVKPAVLNYVYSYETPLRQTLQFLSDKCSWRKDDPSRPKSRHLSCYHHFRVCTYLKFQSCAARQSVIIKAARASMNPNPTNQDAITCRQSSADLSSSSFNITIRPIQTYQAIAGTHQDHPPITNALSHQTVLYNPPSKHSTSQNPH
jgi:hypothetical protein